MNDHVYRIRDEIAWRKMKDGTVTIVSPLVEKIISINATAGMIWELLDGTRTVAAVVDSLYENLGADGVDRATLEADTHQMIQDLIERRLVERIEGARA